MDMQSRNQYLKTLIEKQGYLLKSKREKSRLLNEFCRNAGLNRKYVIRKIRSGRYLQSGLKQNRSKRKPTYDNEVRAALIKVWRIFDHSCGQRLKSSLETEVDRLIKLRELTCPPEVAVKLKTISARTIDTKLKPIKQDEYLQNKYQKKIHPLLYQKIPIKTFIDQDREALGNIQADLVEHCGQSALGPFISSVSTVDIFSGWWAGRAQIGKDKRATHNSLDCLRKGRSPFNWQGVHSDNDTTFINQLFYDYCQKEKIFFSRSRPYKKNDNCLVEEKNKTHIRQLVGHRRYDTLEELEIINELYDVWADYKNFFQPTIQLIRKERIKGRIKRVYGKPVTPYQRLMNYPLLSEDKKRELQERYNSLNPAELQRQIKKLQNSLYETYMKKQGKSQDRSVTFLNCATRAISVT